MPDRQLLHTPCGKVWAPRVEKPVQCPQCHRSIDFDRDLAGGIIVPVLPGQPEWCGAEGGI